MRTGALEKMSGEVWETFQPQREKTVKKSNEFTNLDFPKGKEKRKGERHQRRGVGWTWSQGCRRKPNEKTVDEPKKKGELKPTF